MKGEVRVEIVQGSQTLAAKTLHEGDLRRGLGSTYLPFALARKFPSAGMEWGWQYVFPSGSLGKDPVDGTVRRHHLHESVISRAIRQAARAAGIPKPVTTHCLRHYSEPQTMPSNAA